MILFVFRAKAYIQDFERKQHENLISQDHKAPLLLCRTFQHRQHQQLLFWGTGTFVVGVILTAKTCDILHIKIGLPCIPQGVEQIWKCQHDSSFIAASHALLASFQSVNDLPSGEKLIDDDFIKDTILAKCFHYGRLQRKSQLSGFCLEEPTRSFKITSFSTTNQSVVISSAKSSYSHPDLLMIHHHPSTFSDHTSPQ